MTTGEFIRTGAVKQQVAQFVKDCKSCTKLYEPREDAAKGAAIPLPNRWVLCQWQEKLADGTFVLETMGISRKYSYLHGCARLPSKEKMAEVVAACKEVDWTKVETERNTWLAHFYEYGAAWPGYLSNPVEYKESNMYITTDSKGGASRESCDLLSQGQLVSCMPFSTRRMVMKIMTIEELDRFCT